jgi:WD40 repeat protein/energy-coupling factor transporter ATP-binding protein EcfA2
MVALFVSHSSADNADAVRVGNQLEAAGFVSLFLDFDPSLGIPGGRSWERELYSQLRRTDAVIFLASPASVASRWCFAELCLARSLGKPVFPLRLHGEVMLDLLSDVQWIDWQDEASALARLLGGLRLAGLDPADSFAWDPRRAPYPGLQAFMAEDAGVFFGRDHEIDRLEELFQPTLQRGAGRFVAIVGPSGSGKSSLLHAGLLPRLQRQPERWIVLPPLVPGRQPMRNLARALAETFASAGDARPLDELEASLRRGAPTLVELAMQLTARRAGQQHVLVVIDQAEELVTLTGAGEQQEFLRLLEGAMSEDSPLWTVATVRSEFLSTAPERAGLAEAVHESVVVEPLSRARLPEVIQRPAQRAGIDFAPGLVEQMVVDAQGGDALPLLAYTLRELYRRAGRDGRIDSADYEAVGGVVGALRRRADRLVEDLTRQGRGQQVVPTLLKLAAVEGDSEPTRRRLRRADLTGDEEAVVAAFVDARLLVSGGSAPGEATIEIAHEALLRQWPPLRHAVEASRASLRIRSDLERLAADWRRAREDESYLLRGARLAAIDEWAADHRDEVNPLEQRFLSASRSLASRELDRARRSNRRLQLLASGLALLLVLSVTAGLVAFGLNRRAQSQARVALSGRLAAQADRLAGSQPETAILLGLESLSVARNDNPKQQPTAGLISALARRTHASRLITGHSSEVAAVAFAQSGRFLASASQDRTVRLWSPSGQPYGKPLAARTNELSGVAISPDETLLASGGDDGLVRLWQLPSGRALRPLAGHDAPVYGVAFSPDGTLLASASEDATIRLWDTRSLRPHGTPLSGHADAVYRLAFSPDGRLLASASWDGTVRMWTVPSGKPYLRPLTGHSYEVQSVAFSPDSRLLASSSMDYTIRLWDVRTGRQHGPTLRGHTGEVNGVAFSPDGKLLATTDTDGPVRLWEVASGQPRGLPLTGHTASARDVVFSPDGKWLATAGWDRTIRLWEVAETPSISRPFVGHADEVYSVALSPNGKLLATASADDTVRLWDTASGRPDGPPLAGHTDDVFGVAFSPDGKLVASASGDGTVRLWDAVSHRPHGPPLVGHESFVNSVAFSPDGKLLATGSDDHTVRLWDVASLRPRGRPLEGHTQSVYKVSFSPDGRLLASGSVDRTVRLWDLPGGRSHGRPLIGHTNWVYSVAFSPDGKLLGSSSKDQTIRLWDVGTGRAHGSPITGHTDEVWDVVFSHDGRRLASASADQTVRLWDVATGQAVGQPLTGHTGTVAAVVFGPRDDVLATVSWDRTARSWSPGFGAWLADGCRIVGRNLSAADWSQFVRERPYERTCPELPSGAGAPAHTPAARY